MKCFLSDDQRGVTIIFVAILIVVFLGFVAFAVDIGHLRVVRNEIQNAADAGALDTTTSALFAL
jgi:Flp pilus assembly protein TadG